MGEMTKGGMSVHWIESTGQFWLKYRGGDQVYVASWEGSNQEEARNIIDLMKAYLLTRPDMRPQNLNFSEREGK